MSGPRAPTPRELARSQGSRPGHRWTGTNKGAAGSMQPRGRGQPAVTGSQPVPATRGKGRRQPDEPQDGGTEPPCRSLHRPGAHTPYSSSPCARRHRASGGSGGRAGAGQREGSRPHGRSYSARTSRRHPGHRWWSTRDRGRGPGVREGTTPCPPPAGAPHRGAGEPVPRLPHLQNELFRPPPRRRNCPHSRGHRRGPCGHDQVHCSPKSPRKGVWIPHGVPACPSPPQNEASGHNFHRDDVRAPFSLCPSRSDLVAPDRAGWGPKGAPSGESLSGPWRSWAELHCSRGGHWAWGTPEGLPYQHSCAGQHRAQAS